MSCKATWSVLLSAMLLAGCVGDSGPGSRGGETGAAAEFSSPTRAEFLKQQLSELRELAPPKGVSAADWERLKASLASELQRQLKEATAAGSRTASLAPASDAARIPLKYDLDAGEFQWLYYNPGDYNQDGEVNISDLTPLAVYLNQAVSTAPGAEATIQSVVDGDGNGQVTISDLTPIGAYLGRRITEFKLYFAGSLDAYPASNAQDPQVPALGTVAIGAFSGNRAAQRVSYSLPEDLADGYYWVRPSDGTAQSFGTPSSHIRGSEPHPIPKLEVDPVSGTPPFSASLDATGSYSYQGETKFHFDPEGDGTFLPTGTNATIGHSFTTAANHNPAVRVESLGGLLKRTTAVVNTTGNPRWFRYPLPIPPTTDWIPQGLTLAEHQGWPYALLRYFDQDEQINKLAQGYAASSTGSAWPPIPNWHIGSIQPIGPPVLTRLGLSENTARIESYGSGLYFREAGPNPGTWQPQVNVLNVASPLEWYALKVIGLYPCVAFYDPTADKLGFKRSSSFDGSTWPAQTTNPWGPTVAIGKYACLAAIDGKPAIAFWAEGGAVYYVSASDAQGSAWNAPVWLGGAQGARFYDNLLRLPDGSPALVFSAYGFNDTKLLIKRATNNGGETWNDFTFIAEYDSVLDFMPRALMIDGTAHVFWCPGSADLLHSETLDSTGLVWSEPVVVASGVDSAIWPAPAEIAGYPAVGYVNVDGDFRYAIRY